MSRKHDRRSPIRGLERITIECVSPELDAGRHPVKRVLGDLVIVGADAFKEGHDLVAARVLYRGPDDRDWSFAPMRFEYDEDRWFGSFRADRIGRWTFTVEAWTDQFGSWRAALEKNVNAGQDVGLDLQEGARFVRAAARSAKDSATRATLVQTAKVLDDRRDETLPLRIQRALDPELLTLMAQFHKPADLTRFRRELTVVVDRERARFAAWYEMFPRSQVPPEKAHDFTARAGATHAHGTFDDAAKRLPRLAELGFDVVYLPPIHPIGRTLRKGRNNTLQAQPGDVGSPWAIGAEEGGHTAIHPQLGTVADFERFVQKANALGMDVALDYALQCSPDHPWVREHPEWFHIRPDGSIKYAENPPKKYQDIYPMNFWCADRVGLWNACRDVFLYWIARGVKTFRVDNPHTKAFPFWEWCIQEIHDEHPDVIFFSEAFTRPKRMKHLAKLGFTMSYTYFTWKNQSWELRDYLEELTRGPAAEYYRGNFFANTPDILNEYLVTGGRPAFRIRLMLAATLLPLYGIYSGFELCENVPVRPGSEEYLDSEKYQVKPRDYEAPGNINGDIQRINQIRQEHAALQLYANLSFHTSENPAILFYRKAPRERPIQWAGSRLQTLPSWVLEDPGAPERLASPGGDREADILVAVTTDPHKAQDTMVHVPIAEMGIGADQPYVVHDLMTGARYTWRGVRNYVRIDPAAQPGHVFRVEKA